MAHDVLRFHEIDQTQTAVVGGKGAQLGELARLSGVNVPASFCVTTDAFQRVMAAAPALDGLLDQLSRLRPDDREAIGTVSAAIRTTLEEVAIPEALAATITRALADLGADGAYAVRSSATAEDLPTASFAGQHDSYLNVAGPAAVLEHVRRCWASLFTDRAVTYRLRNGFDHRKVHMAVVVQRMVDAEAAGVLFTADPVSGNRKVTSVEAVSGLGEALVSGVVNADVYKIRDGRVVQRTEQHDPVLSDAQLIRLEELGRRIEAHFGRPQDIEWCRTGDVLHIVQTRPITTLYPVPAAGDDEKHVYVSVGHQQMMTDAMKPLGLSFWLLITRAPMCEAAGRLFVDISRQLATPAGRAGLFGTLGRSEPLIRDALQTIVDREFIPLDPDAGSGGPPAGGAPPPLETDPAIPARLIEEHRASIAAAQRDIATRSGVALLDFIRADVEELRRILFVPESYQVIMAGIEASWWLNDHLHEWLGEKNAADTLAQSVPHNITSEMGLALLDVADVIRPHPEVVAFLQQVEDDSFLGELAKLPGGQEACAAITSYLERYGMRCVGEVDITRPRWSEHPSTLVPLILSNVKNFEPGAGARRFEEGRQEAEKAEQEVLGRLRALPDGEAKAAEAKRMIDRLRTFSGYREFPKYGWMSRTFLYRRALLEEAARLVQANVLGTTEDIYFLTFDELHDVVRTNEVDGELIRRRRDAFRSYEALTPPRMITSEGEIIAGQYRRDDLPAGALVGQPVSAGTVEGRARVILDMADADLEAGDILVTAYTDPSWSPLFVAIEGLVTEVGGLMTHGSVVAREYGLPAVVGVENATRLIRDGQRIRVHGADGYVEILKDI